MGFLQMMIRQLSGLKLLSGLVTNGAEEETDPKLLEFKLLLESLNYNPMLNHLVIETIFEYCSPSDLLGFRLVCKTWHELATARLLHNDPIHRVVTHELELTRLLNLTKNSGSSFPIQSFYIKIPSLSFPSQTLFKTLTLPCIVSLKIVIESKHFPGTVRAIKMQMRTLKHLVIYRIPEQSFEALGCASTPGGGSPSLPPGKMPNLLSLTLKNAKPSRNFLATYDGAVIELIRAARTNLQSLEFWNWGLLTRILREGSFSGIKNFRVVGGKLSESDMMVLVEKAGLLLERFSARVDKSVSKHLVKEFLDKRIDRN